MKVPVTLFVIAVATLASSQDVARNGGIPAGAPGEDRRPHLFTPPNQAPGSIRVEDLILCDQTADNAEPPLIEVQYDTWGLMEPRGSRFLYLRVTAGGAVQIEVANRSGLAFFPSGCPLERTLKVERGEMRLIQKLVDSVEVRDLHGVYGYGPGIDAGQKLTIQIFREKTHQVFSVVNPCSPRDGNMPRSLRLLCKLDEVRPVGLDYHPFWGLDQDYKVSQNFGCELN